MPREKETYRDVLARIAGRANELYPGRMIFNKKQCAAILGVHRDENILRKPPARPARMDKPYL